MERVGDAEMSSLEIKGLSKSFRGIRAVKNISFKLEDGKLLVLLGPSGCGKTTTLRCIAGLESPDKGAIKLGGKTINDVSPAKRNIAMVFQRSTVYPHMRVEENLSLPLETRSVPKKEIEKRVRETLKLLEIEELRGRYANELSGGQRQRVAIGKAIIRKPEVFLMDEPLSDLDAKLKVSMRDRVKRLQMETGTTTVYVTHDQEEAMSVGDVIAVLKDGRIQQIGMPSEIYDSPNSLFVATFIGSPSMNILEASWNRKGSSLRLRGSESTLDLSYIPLDLTRGLSSEVLLGVRPEHLSLSKRERSKNFLMKGSVSTIQNWGNEGLVTIEMGIKRIRVRSEKFGDFKAGDMVRILFRTDKIYLFDKGTGECLVNPNIIAHNIYMVRRIKT